MLVAAGATKHDSLIALAYHAFSVGVINGETPIIEFVPTLPEVDLADRGQLAHATDALLATVLLLPGW